MPVKLLRHPLKVSPWMSYARQSSVIGTPASSSFKMARICSVECLAFLMVFSLPAVSLGNSTGYLAAHVGKQSQSTTGTKSEGKATITLGKELTELSATRAPYVSTIHLPVGYRELFDHGKRVEGSAASGKNNKISIKFIKSDHSLELNDAPSYFQSAIPDEQGLPVIEEKIYQPIKGKVIRGLLVERSRIKRGRLTYEARFYLPQSIAKEGNDECLVVSLFISESFKETPQLGIGKRLKQLKQEFTDPIMNNISLEYSKE